MPRAFARGRPSSELAPSFFRFLFVFCIFVSLLVVFVFVSVSFIRFAYIVVNIHFDLHILVFQATDWRDQIHGRFR
ncbi:hypothetical protein Y032_0777g2273 [Ancylostoma ceylanicum]|uniref:Uncharacterized protein n=1 Tax=Ancylostoma ceylanicum TaxID=53326 RepID=A0A016WD99_9BILA|nr:hypothetical protein Y032_0777g2273 [Ancylostoma ceylanicum]